MEGQACRGVMHYALPTRKICKDLKELLDKTGLSVYTPTMKKGSKQLEIAKCAEIAATCACLNIRKAARAVTQLYDAAARPTTGLRATQVSILVATRMLGPVTMKHLAKAIVMDRTTLTRNLKLLEKQGFIQIQPGNDRRVREISLADQGHEVLVRAYPSWKQVQSKMIRSLGQERFDRLLLDLSDVVAATKLI